MNVVWVCGGTTMIDGEVAAVGMVSYCFEGVNGYAPIGFAAGWCTVFLGAGFSVRRDVEGDPRPYRRYFISKANASAWHDKYVVVLVCFNEAKSFVFLYYFYDSSSDW